MKLKSIELEPYTFLLTNGRVRSCVWIHMVTTENQKASGDIAPLPSYSSETLTDALDQINNMRNKLLKIEWSSANCHFELERLNLYPSTSFGLQTALLSILEPLADCRVNVSAFLMGSKAEIMEKAEKRHLEGYHSAKLKVSQLSFSEAFEVIEYLKDKFYLRIDVNRAWETNASIEFFSQFSFNQFDYVEEPFQNPHDLSKFTHPLAIDESFPSKLSLKTLEQLPNMKALIYKPSIQGGLYHSSPVYEWTKKQNKMLVLSSSFESHIGLQGIAATAKRLSIQAPVGIGTFHYYKYKLPDISY